MLKPFVFLDLFDMEKASFPGIGLHPHSGIATVTYLFEGSVRYEDTTGASGLLLAGGVEWFKAGRGAWHGGGPGDTGRARGFQLWLALPPEQELGPVENVYLAPDAGARSGRDPRRGDELARFSDLAELPGSALASWRVLALPTAIDHTVGWVSPSTGRLRVPETVEAGELAIFEPSNQAIDFHADADTEFVLGSARPHAHDLMLGQYSVHSSPAMLRAGEQRLNEIQRRLQREGRL